jgi:hypothetical protein
LLGGLCFSEVATGYFKRKYDIPCLSLRVWKVKLEGESIWGICSFDRKRKNLRTRKFFYKHGIFNKCQGREFLVTEESNMLEFGCHTPYLKFWVSVLMKTCDLVLQGVYACESTEAHGLCRK